VITRRTALGADLRKRCPAHRSALPDYGSEGWGFDSLPGALEEFDTPALRLTPINAAVVLAPSEQPLAPKSPYFWVKIVFVTAP